MSERNKTDMFIQMSPNYSKCIRVCQFNISANSVQSRFHHTFQKNRTVTSKTIEFFFKEVTFVNFPFLSVEFANPAIRSVIPPS